LTAKQTRRQTPASRRRSHRPTQGRRLGWPGRVVLTALGTALFLLSWGILARQFAPVSNTSLTRFDAIIVLGTPADDDGNPTPTLLARINEGVAEYKRGVAPRLIFTGGAAHNRFVEAQVMAKAAHAQGIPESAIFEEPQAMDTIQNACYSVRIMEAHGWHSAEVVSNHSHLPRAGLIFNRLPLEWRTHAAPPLSSDSVVGQNAATMIETLKTVRYLVWTRQMERCEP
jgi:uncharacterized SAM-binding protein YcdF (DUF218 family)